MTKRERLLAIRERADILFINTLDGGTERLAGIISDLIDELLESSEEQTSVGDRDG